MLPRHYHNDGSTFLAYPTNCGVKLTWTFNRSKTCCTFMNNRIMYKATNQSPVTARDVKDNHQEHNMTSWEIKYYIFNFSAKRLKN